MLVDPGHGGPDSGAIGPNQTYEKDNNLAIALALKDVLEKAGAKVLLTRDKDVSIVNDYSELNDLQARVDLANNNNVDLFVSIHNDSFGKPEVHGTSTFYDSRNPKSNESLHLANSVQNAFIDIIETQNREVKQAPLYVLGNTNMPAILLETAFISNPYEEARLQNPTFQKNVAAAIFHGIFNYYKNPIPES
ncbi:cell wall hydrolase [Desulfitobacterium metallireducens DSM 15288]|uniref:Cell wall hydrolase n=1 Tax=Desulfitobacterium metallireducens DSM 15288 TaxID=871968 RepID=W0EB96_9FIRM|nr:cell wall hydrolase [Desulfitobacterium metallireducens DSM 15288]